MYNIILLILVSDKCKLKCELMQVFIFMCFLEKKNASFLVVYLFDKFFSWQIKLICNLSIHSPRQKLINVYYMCMKCL